MAISLEILRHHSIYQPLADLAALARHYGNLQHNSDVFVAILLTCNQLQNILYPTLRKGNVSVVEDLTFSLAARTVSSSVTNVFRSVTAPPTAGISFCLISAASHV